MSIMSGKQPKKKSLKLLEKLVQDNSSEEGAEEREALFDSLIKENGGNHFYEKMNGSYTKKGKTKAGKEAENERQSRSRTKDQHDRILYARKPPTGQGSISVPSGHVKNGKSRSRSRSGSRSSSSSFWSSGSKSRSRSKSPKRGTPRSSRRRSYSSSRSRSHSRSRSRSRSQSRSRSRSKSSSPHSYVHGVQTHLNLKNSSKPHDTMSEQGHRQRKKDQHGRKTKLLNRSPLRKFRSMDINPDVFIEERLNQKYRELHELVQTSFGDRRPQVTREYFNQIQSLRDSYTKVSHGLQPSGILLPGTGMLSDIKPPGVPQRRRPMSASTHAELRDLTSEDGTYYTIRNVMTASTAKQQQKVRTDINGDGFSKKKKKKKRSDHKRKDSGSTIDSTVHHNGYHDNPPGNRTPSSSKATGSPRQKEPPVPMDHHIKHSNNPELLSWLKQKDVNHRKQKREERQKKKEERHKVILEANEKFEKRLESQKQVDKWMKVKQKESRARSREEKMREKIRSRERINQENANTLTVPGKPLRPQSAPPKKGAHSGKESSQQENVQVAPEVTRLKDEELRQAKTMGMEPHPPASKFIYKRPVAGRIKLTMRERPKSASVITPQRNASASPRRVSARDKSNENRQRMSYEDWLQQKRKHEIQQKKEIQLQKEELAKSDPELAKIVPEIAKKRIHRVLEGKKSIDTGIKNFDDRANKSFGGADFHDEDVSAGEEKSPRPSYRLDSDRTSQADQDNSSRNLKLSGQSVNMDSRPGTAPARGRVPTPKRSSNSPRKAVAPPKDKMSDEVSTGFSLPFQEKDGVPKHVASTQRKLFAEKVWGKLEDEERPEPQGCAATETTPHLPSSQGETQSTKVDNSTKTENNAKSDDSNTTAGENITKEKESTGKKEEEEQKEEIVGDFFLTSREDILDDVKTENGSEQTVETPANEEGKVEEPSMNEDVKDDRENEEKMEKVSSEVKPPVNDLETDSGDLAGGIDTQNGRDDQQGFSDSEAKDNSPRQDDTKPKLHSNTENLRPESENTSRSYKHVSFSEETEVFGKDEPEGEEVDWSTDTATPDVDDYASMARDDLNVEEDTREENDVEESVPEEVPSQMSRTSLAESMEEDF